MDQPSRIGAAVDALNEHHVRYILIGGAAMMLHGSAYQTLDIDICYEHTRPNIEALVAALRPFRPQLRVATGEVLPFRWEARTIQNGQNFTLSTDIGDIDILATVAGFATFADIKKLSGRFQIGDRNVPMLTIYGLIAAKRAAGRTKDLLALPELEAMAEARSFIANDRMVTDDTEFD